MTAGLKMEYQRETIEQFTAWQAARGLEEGTKIFYLPTLPSSPAAAMMEALTSLVAFGRAQKSLTDAEISRVRNEMRRVDQQSLTRMDAMWPRQIRIECVGKALLAVPAFGSIVQNNAYWFCGSLGNEARERSTTKSCGKRLGGTYSLDLFHRTGRSVASTPSSSTAWRSARLTATRHPLQTSAAP